MFLDTLSFLRYVKEKNYTSRTDAAMVLNRKAFKT